MTRRDAGRPHKWWTERELAYIRERAGRVPAREIRRDLRVGARQLESAVRSMRLRGEDICLRSYRRRTLICPACGCRRALFGRDGICEPCRRARQLAELEGRISDLLALLPPGERRVYEETESGREARAVDPMPSPPRTAGMDRYRRDRAEDEYDMAVERWQARRLKRLVRAAQKRKERIARKVRELRRED